MIYESGINLPEFASFLALFDPGPREALETIYRSYIDIAVEFQRPMQVGAPTWRAHPECLQRLGFNQPEDFHRVNGAAVSLLKELRSARRGDELVMIAGVMGPRFDGYDPTRAPDADESCRYHMFQAEALVELGVDLLYAPTFASTAELRGVARAMAATGVPDALAPVLGADGRVLDGSLIADVMKEIDTTVAPTPLHYLGGCVHPTRFRQGFDVIRTEPLVAPRLAGLKPNASVLAPEALDKLNHLEEGQPAAFASDMAACTATLD